MRQAGAATLLVSGLLAVSVLAAGLLLDVAQVAATRAGLTAAADAAALAAAPITFAGFGSDSHPRAAAAAIAAENGARLEACHCDIDRSWAARTVVVVVSADTDLLLLRDRRLQATAAAQFRPVLLGHTHSADQTRGAKVDW